MLAKTNGQASSSQTSRSSLLQPLSSCAELFKGKMRFGRRLKFWETEQDTPSTSALTSNSGEWDKVRQTDDSKSRNLPSLLSPRADFSAKFLGESSDRDNHFRTDRQTGLPSQCDLINTTVGVPERTPFIALNTGFVCVQHGPLGRISYLG